MTKNEDLKALTVHDELFTLVESQTGKVLLHSEMNDIINVVEKYSTRPTVTPADGDAEREYTLGNLCDRKSHELISIIIALQAQRRDLLSSCRAYEKEFGFIEGGRDPLFAKKAAIQSTRNPPVHVDDEKYLECYRDTALSAAADINDGYIDAKTKRAVNAAINVILFAALQSTRKPPDKCDGEPSTYWSTKQDFVHPVPVDTIAVPRPVKAQLILKEIKK